MVSCFLWLLVEERIAEPAEDKSGGTVKVVEQVQGESENRKCQSFATVEKPVELVIENRDDPEQHNNQEQQLRLQNRERKQQQR